MFARSIWQQNCSDITATPPKSIENRCVWKNVMRISEIVIAAPPPHIINKQDLFNRGTFVIFTYVSA